MKALTLYIDKWYIIGAVCTDGVPRLITLSNHEDRFWLFFYEDTYNNSIVYGKDNQSHYRNGEAHYIGDVFSLITDPDRRFSRYNGRGEELKTIFQASGIFDTLRSAVDAEGEIETYISFSPDIPGPARLVFFEELKSNGFNVIGSQARIGFLALEHNRRHEKLQDDGYYLVLNACNENLHYILYKREDNKFKMFSENVLVGMGMDLRGRALVESIVDSINNRTHFLSTKEEVEREYLRMEQFVQNWFVKIANAKPYVPITIPNVSFANQPANTYQVSIIRNKLDERTSVIVGNIIKVVADFTKSSGVRNDEIKGLVFIGNTFTNSQFERAIREKFYVAEDNVIRHKESDLPNIVGVYPLLGDLHESDWQKTAEKDLGEIQIRAAFDKERELLEDLIDSRSWEEARAHLDKMSNLYLDYSSELSGYKTVIDRGIVEDGNKSARQYDDAMQKVYDFEKNQDYAQMSDWADIALQHRPGDKEATQKKADAVRLLSEQKVREEQYRAIIGRAQKSLKDGQWQDALSQSDAALNLRPTSVEAKRIYNEAKKHIEASKEIDKYINRADLFFAQKAFDEALRELAKVQSLDPENAEAAQRIKEIEDIRKEHTQKLASLVEQYEKAKSALNYDTAIDVCEKLIEIDTLNQRKWSAETERLKAEKEKAAEAKKRYDDLKKKAMDADFRGDWASLIRYAEKALLLKEDEDLRSRIAKANTMLKKSQIKKYVEAAEEAAQSGAYRKAVSLIKEALVVTPEDRSLQEIMSNYEKKNEVMSLEVGKIVEEIASKKKLFDFRSAISLCQRLIDIDTENQNKWREEMQTLQSLQIEKSDLELNYRRKKADIKQLIRSGNIKTAKESIKTIRQKYLSFGITSHEHDFISLLDEIEPDSKPSEHIKKNTGKKDIGSNPAGLSIDTNTYGKNHSGKHKFLKSEKVLVSTKPDITIANSDIDEEGLMLLREGKFVNAKRHFAICKNKTMAEVCTDLIRLDRAKKTGSISESDLNLLKTICEKYNLTI